MDRRRVRLPAGKAVRTLGAAPVSIAARVFLTCLFALAVCLVLDSELRDKFGHDSRPRVRFATWVILPIMLAGVGSVFWWVWS